MRVFLLSSYFEQLVSYVFDDKCLITVNDLYKVISSWELNVSCILN
jgi:hypothetical protein